MFIRKSSKWYRRIAEDQRECCGVFVEVARHSEGYESGNLIASLEVEYKDGTISKRKKSVFLEFLPHIISQEVKLPFDPPVQIGKEDVHYFKVGLEPGEATTEQTEPEDPHQADVESLHYEEMREGMLESDYIKIVHQTQTVMPADNSIIIYQNDQLCDYIAS